MTDVSGHEMSASVMDAMADPVLAMGPDGTLLFMNRAAVDRGGWVPAEVLGTPVMGLVHPDDLGTALASMVSVLDKETGSLVELRVRDSTGEYATYEVRGRAWPAGPVEGAVVITLRELSDRHQWDVSGGDPQLLRALLDHLPTISVLISPDGTIRSANRALTRSLHRPIEGTVGSSFLDLVDEVDRGLVRSELAAIVGTCQTRHLEASLLTLAGAPLPMSLVVVDMTTDRLVRGVVVVAHDISALVDARHELRRLAGHDDLTGLPNRTTLRDHLTHLLAVPSEPSHTVLFGDVDNLKAVNDRYGHRAGDALLVATAHRLRSAVRPEDFVARLGGDEFVVVVASADERVLASLQERIANSMAEPVVLPGGHRISTSISIGVAQVEASVDADDLLAAADAAMYVSKRERNQLRD